MHLNLHSTVIFRLEWGYGRMDVKLSTNTCVYVRHVWILHVECCVHSLPLRKRSFGQICTAIRANPYITYTLFTR